MDILYDALPTSKLGQLEAFKAFLVCSMTKKSGKLLSLIGQQTAELDFCLILYTLYYYSRVKRKMEGSSNAEESSEDEAGNNNQQHQNNQIRLSSHYQNPEDLVQFVLSGLLVDRTLHLRRRV